MDNKEISLLAVKFQNGDKDAFRQIYLLTQKNIYFMCCKFLKNEEDIWDVVQDTYMTAIEKISELKNPEYFLTWLNRIAINKCKNKLTRSKANLFVDDEDEEQLMNIEEIADDFLPERYVENADLRHRVLEIIENDLSDVQRTTIILFYYNEESIASISEIMECSQGTVKSRLNSAKKIIKKKIEESDRDTKTYAVVVLPFLTRLFRQASDECVVPQELSNSILNSAFEKIGGIPQVNTPKTGGLMNTKVIVGISVAAVVAVGGAVAGITIANNNSNTADTVQPQSSISASQDTESNTVSQSENNSTVSSAETSEDTINYDYMPLSDIDTPNHKIETAVAYVKDGREGKAYQITPEITVDFDAAVAVIENSDFYKANYDFVYKSTSEEQEMKTYSDIEGVYSKYELTYSFFARNKNSEDDINQRDYPNGIKFEVYRDVSDFTAPNKIVLEIEGDVTREKEIFAYDVLSAAVGDEYATRIVRQEEDSWENRRVERYGNYYSCSEKTFYSETDSEYNIRTYTNFQRRINFDMFYQIEIGMSKSNTFDYYSGDYSSIYNTLPIQFDDVFSEKVGSLDLSDPETFMSDYMKAGETEYLTYIMTYFDSFSYGKGHYEAVNCTSKTLANGDVQNIIIANPNMGCEDVSKLICPSTRIEISTITSNGKTTVDYIKVIGGVGLMKMEEDEAEKEESYKVLLETAKNAIPMLFEGIDCSSVKYESGVESYNVEGKVTVADTEMPYTIELKVGDSMADVSGSSYILEIGDCSQALLQK